MTEFIIDSIKRTLIPEIRKTIKEEFERQKLEYFKERSCRKGNNDSGTYDRNKNKVDLIMDIVCNRFNIEKTDIRHKTRKREIVGPRQIAMVLLARNTDLSLASIGQLFGKKDHTTVVHSRYTVDNLYQTDEKFRETFDLLERKIQ